MSRIYTSKNKMLFNIKSKNLTIFCSGVVFAWRFTWNYAYSPFNSKIVWYSTWSYAYSPFKSKNCMIFQVKGKMSKSEMDGAIDFLTSEGHIYSTIDDEHFKTIDAE